MASPEAEIDLVAIGRCAIDLYGQQIGGRLEDMGSFAKYLGGSPANTVVGGARLGLKTALVTRVGADHMGRFLAEELCREGVDTRGVHSDPDRLTAMVVLGIRSSEDFPMVFFRENCADMALDEGDIDPALIASAGATLISGTHLSRPHSFAACMKAIEIAKAAGRRVAFDIDYRPVLWGLEARDMGENRYVESAATTDRLIQVLPHCDLVVGTEEEMMILGGSPDLFTALRTIRGLCAGLIVCKLGAQGCVAFPDAIPETLEGGVLVDGFPVEVFNVLGAGDAFMAGFLSGWLRDATVGQCCRLGNAAGAIVVSRHGCAPAMPFSAELDYLMATQDLPFRLRDDAMLAHMHWAGARRPRYDELVVLAIDHRHQFEEIARKLEADLQRVGQFKTLALAAVQRVAAGRDGFGILLDSGQGRRALERTAGEPIWVGRAIEMPNAPALEFEGGPDVATEIATWPVDHVVKCLVQYHPSADPAFKTHQAERLTQLFDACRKTGHELLVEIIASRHGPVDRHTAATAIQEIYALDIRPDWWKLEPSTDPGCWQAIETVILNNDPLCRGIVLLGLSASPEQLVAAFRAAAGTPLVRGFAVGRTIFEPTARQWLSYAITDDEAVDSLASGFDALVAAWRAARDMALCA